MPVKISFRSRYGMVFSTRTNLRHRYPEVRPIKVFVINLKTRNGRFAYSAQLRFKKPVYLLHSTGGRGGGATTGARRDTTVLFFRASRGSPRLAIDPGGMQGGLCPDLVSIILPSLFVQAADVPRGWPQLLQDLDNVSETETKELRTTYGLALVMPVSAIQASLIRMPLDTSNPTAFPSTPLTDLWWLRGCREDRNGFRTGIIVVQRVCHPCLESFKCRVRGFRNGALVKR